MKQNLKPWLIGGAILLILIIAGIIFAVSQSDQNTTETTLNFRLDNSDEDIDWSEYPAYKVELSESYTISKAGVYYLSGTITDGAVTIKVDDNVKLILDGATIKHSSGPAIFVAEAKNVVISTAAGSQNFLEDGATYSGYADDEIGTIFSHDDLILTGEGTLEVVSHAEDAIVGKDDLSITSGTYKITSADDAIRGKDSVHITGGTFTINATGKGIQSTNTIETDKGFIYIEQGDFQITSSDDAIHSNNHVRIQDGNFEITSGDDGIHADNELVIDGGQINITKSYEGLEATNITINGGAISLVASDDGINAAGGADGSAMNRPGAKQYASDASGKLIINGGEVTINSTGDGLDSNGNIYQNGGKVVVYGPTSGADGALDYDGSYTMTGGNLVAGGASGMFQTIGQDSSIAGVAIGFGGNVAAGQTITIEAADGTLISSYSSPKSFSALVVASSEFQQNATYTIKVDGTTYTTFTISGTTTTVGNLNSGGMMHGGGQAGPGAPGGMQNGRR